MTTDHSAPSCEDVMAAAEEFWKGLRSFGPARSYLRSAIEAYGRGCAEVERGACAAACDTASATYQAAGASVALECATAIRARGQEKSNA